jgi:hypothetical protein
MEVPVSSQTVFRDAGDRNATDLSPFRILTTYNVSIFYMLWYFMVCHWNLVNYVAWVQFNGDLLGNSPHPRLYLACVVIALFVFWVIGGFLLYRSAKYAKSDKDRFRYFSAGLGVLYLFTDVPLWICDIAIVFQQGFWNEIQGITLLLRTISFIANSVVAWHIYMHRMAKFLHTVVWAGRIDTREIAMKKMQLNKEKELRRMRRSS